MSEKKMIRISTSLINEMMPEGEEKALCPLQLKLSRIDKKYRREMSEAMASGSYFEYICLGAGAGDDTVTDLRSVKAGRGGAKSVDQERIEDQARNFENIAKELGVVIGPENVQLAVFKEWDHEYNEWADEYDILITGILDLVSPIRGMAFKEQGERLPLDFPEAVHDLKLTKDVWGTFGRNRCWAYPWTMDHTQLAIYNYITDLPTFYWVFDYKPRPEFRIYHKEMTSIEKLEMHETIRKTVERYIELDKLGWPAGPAYYRCQNCPVSAEDCSQRSVKPDIQIF